MRHQEEKEAYLSSLNDPLQANLFQGFADEAIQEAQEQCNQQLDELPVEPPLPKALPLPPLPIEPPQQQNALPSQPQQHGQQEGINSAQQTLRSKRISERGTTKRYMEERNKARKCDKETFMEADMDPAAQAELLRALGDEFHATNPLQQQVVDQADIYCGIQQSSKDPINHGMDQNVGATGGIFNNSI